MSKPHTDRETQRTTAQRELADHLTAARTLADRLGLSACAYLIDMAIKEAEHSRTLKTT